MKRPVSFLWWPVFLLGCLAGLSLMQGATSQERLQTASALDKWQARAQYWKREATRLQEELGSINRKSEKHLYIQNVTVTVIKSPVPTHEVIEALSPYTQSLLGLSLQYLKLSVIYHVFNNRIVAIGTHLYQIHVQALLLGPHCELLISVLPRPSSSSL